MNMKAEPQILRIFISYASEDLVIATALAKSLRDALGDVFAEIYIDRWFLEAGEEFKKQIESTLERTNVFISLYTNTNKQWPAWEVGFFERVMKDASNTRRLVPIFLDTVPGTISSYQGIGLKVPTSHLQLGVDEFTIINAAIDLEEPMCKFMTQMQEIVDEYREAGGYPKAQRTAEQDPVKCVRLLKLAIFNYLKTTIQETVRPQKQILIRTTGFALQMSELDLPHDAQLVPAGQSNAMSSIFGLTDAARSWEKFLDETTGNEHAESWRAAIVSVVTSSFPSRIDVDNSQIVVSSDGAKAYRVILTSTVRYFDDKRELNLYFVEALRRGDFGDEETTLLLRALELSCRFRFMFFEKSSSFSSLSVKLSQIEALPILGARILKELNLLRKESREAGLDHVGQWMKLVNPGQFAEMVQGYQPMERRIRDLATRILEAKGKAEVLSACQAELVAALEELQRTVEPGNSSLIQEMTRKLQVATTYGRDVG
jgi:hypothetical protein